MGEADIPELDQYIRQLQIVLTFEPLAQTYHVKMWLGKADSAKYKKSFHSRISSRSPRRRLIPTSQRPGRAGALNLEPINT